MGYPTFIEESLERLRHEFERTRNLLIALEAYGIVGGLQDFDGFPLPVPEWIRKALYDVAVSLAQIREGAQSRGVDWQSAIVRGLGFQASNRGGRSNPFRVAARSDDRYTFAVHMRVLIDREGHQETYAADEIARYWGVSASTVHRAWKDYGQAVRNGNLEQQTWEVRLRDGAFIPFFGSPPGLAYYGNNEGAADELTEAQLLEALIWGWDDLEEWANVSSFR
jgi:hypothetical protein